MTSAELFDVVTMAWAIMGTLVAIIVLAILVSQAPAAAMWQKLATAVLMGVTWPWPAWLLVKGLVERAKGKFNG